MRTTVEFLFHIHRLGKGTEFYTNRRSHYINRPTGVFLVKRCARLSMLLNVEWRLQRARLELSLPRLCFCNLTRRGGNSANFPPTLLTSPVSLAMRGVTGLNFAKPHMLW